MQRVFASLALALLALLAGCSDQTAILVEVSSPDLTAPGDIDRIEFIATGTSGVMAQQESDLPGSWPQSFAVRGGTGQRGELVQIQVIGKLGGNQRIRRVVSARLVDGQEVKVSVVLTRNCLDVMCSGTNDCAGGMCVGEMPMMDGGVVETDAGQNDAGVPPVDGGLDAQMPMVDAGIDAGQDAGFDAGIDAGPPPVDAGPEGAVYITEYLEQESDKAVEIYNGTSSAIAAGDCLLRRYANGRTTSTDITLDEIPANDVLVVCARSIAGVSCDQNSGTISHNGNDAYDLFCDGSVVDTFGRIGQDPGEAWGTAPTSTQDSVLRRRCTVTMGDSNGSDAFDPATEWEGFAPAERSDFGRRNCP